MKGANILYFTDNIAALFAWLFFIGGMMEKRVAVISIIVDNLDSVSKLNEILHDFSDYIIGRMGIPYREKNISIISVAVDAPQDMIASVSGRIGRLNGVSVKTAYSGVKS